MKKAAIAIALVLVTGLTAFTVFAKENKTEKVTVKIENAAETASTSSARALATAD